MELKSYISAMEHWSGRVDSETDYDAFRWHQWVRPLDLTEDHDDFYCEYGFAFIGFCSEEGVERNNGRIGTAKAPNYIRGKLSNLPCVFEKTVKMYDAGNIVCDDISIFNPPGKTTTNFISGNNSSIYYTVLHHTSTFNNSDKTAKYRITSNRDIRKCQIDYRSSFDVSKKPKP